MAFISGDGSRSPRSRHTAVLIALPLAALLVVVAVLVGRATSDSTSVTDGPAPVVIVRWDRVGGEPVPISAAHGPRRDGDGMATGFSHDELGAALAAIHISTRLTGAAGPLVYETTAREQCVDGSDATVAAIMTQSSEAVAGSTVASEFLYRVSGGAAGGDLVQVTIAARSPQATSQGGYAAFDRTLQWTGGDWRMQCPPPPPRLVISVDGFTTLGSTHA